MAGCFFSSTQGPEAETAWTNIATHGGLRCYQKKHFVGFKRNHSNGFAFVVAKFNQVSCSIQYFYNGAHLPGYQFIIGQIFLQRYNIQ